MNRPSALLLIALPLCLEACTSTGAYPSLYIRDTERVTGTADPVTAGTPLPQTSPPSESLQANVERLLAEARSAHGDFQAYRETAQRVVSGGKGAAKASETWVSVQVALAQLEARRSEAVIALAEIDQLYADELVARPETPTSQTATLLGSARAQVKAMVEEENGVIDRLAGQSGG